MEASTSSQQRIKLAPNRMTPGERAFILLARGVTLLLGFFLLLAGVVALLDGDSLIGSVAMAVIGGAIAFGAAKARAGAASGTIGVDSTGITVTDPATLDEPQHVSPGVLSAVALSKGGFEWSEMERTFPDHEFVDREAPEDEEAPEYEIEWDEEDEGQHHQFWGSGGLSGVLGQDAGEPNVMLLFNRRQTFAHAKQKTRADSSVAIRDREVTSLLMRVANPKQFEEALLRVGLAVPIRKMEFQAPPQRWHQTFAAFAVFVMLLGFGITLEGHTAPGLLIVFVCLAVVVVSTLKTRRATKVAYQQVQSTGN